MEVTVLCTLDATDGEADDEKGGGEGMEGGKFFGDLLLLDVSFAFLPTQVSFPFSSKDLIANHLIIK
jgi:hypothetical protein